MNKKACIFCGAKAGNSIEIMNQTKLLCDLLIRSGYGLVYGGGNAGLMGVIANRFLESGQEVIGVRPKLLIKNENANENLTELFVVDTMQERKKKFIELADLFIALPGGVGTLDEIIETFTLFKIGFIKKQSAILNTAGYYDSLIAFLENMSKYDFLSNEDRAGLIISSNPNALMKQLNIKEIDSKHTTEIDKIAFIDIQDGKILVSKSIGKNVYYIPGGKRENGETDEHTLIREVKEELSVDIIPNTIEYYGIFTAQADGKKEGVAVRMTCYKAKYEKTLKPANEIEVIDWLEFKDIEMVAAVDKKIFKHLKANNQIN